MRLDSGKLYKSGTPKRNLLLSISNIDSGYCGHLPRCNRGLPRCVVGLPLCICLIILLILDQSGVTAGLLGSNGLLGSYGRVVEVESAVSGFFPAVPCDRIEVVITEEVITVIPINGIGCVFLALDCLNGGLERSNGSGNQMRLQSFNCRGKRLLPSFKSCKEFAIGVERNRTGKKRIYSRIVKGGHICVPSCIRAAVIICSCAILASFYIVELRKSVIVITDNTGSTIVMVGFVTLLWFRVLRMCQRDPAGILKNVEHGYPVLSCGLHADICTRVLCKPVSQPPQSVGKRGEASLLILCPSVCICDSNTGVNPCFVDIQPTAVFAENLKSHLEPPAHQDLRRLGRDWLPGKIESI